MSYARGPFSDQPEVVETPDADEVLPLRRMYLGEPGWRISVKAGYERDFCYMMTPGQDFYHRLLDGEIFLQRGEEKLCLSCAVRRGLLVTEPRRLRETVLPLPVDTECIPLDLGWREAERP